MDYLYNKKSPIFPKPIFDGSTSSFTKEDLEDHLSKSQMMKLAQLTRTLYPTVCQTTKAGVFLDHYKVKCLAAAMSRIMTRPTGFNAAQDEKDGIEAVTHLLINCNDFFENVPEIM